MSVDWRSVFFFFPGTATFNQKIEGTLVVVAGVSLISSQSCSFNPTAIIQTSQLQLFLQDRNCSRSVHSALTNGEHGVVDLPSTCICKGWCSSTLYAVPFDQLKTCVFWGSGRLTGTLLGVKSQPSLPVSAQGQAHFLIEEAVDKKNLGDMYIWWMPWF
jgi:hypothetical protein